MIGRPTSRLQHAALDLVLLDGLEERLEVALAEAVITLALDEFEKDRPDHGLGEYLQEDARHAAVDDPLAIDQDAVLLQPIERLGMARKPPAGAVRVDVGRGRHELGGLGRDW